VKKITPNQQVSGKFRVRVRVRKIESGISEMLKCFFSSFPFFGKENFFFCMYEKTRSFRQEWDFNP